MDYEASPIAIFSHCPLELSPPSLGPWQKTESTYSPAFCPPSVFLVASPASGLSKRSNHPSQTPLASRDPKIFPTHSYALRNPRVPLRQFGRFSVLLADSFNKLIRLANCEAGLRQTRSRENFTVARRKPVCSMPTASSSADVRWLAL